MHYAVNKVVTNAGIKQHGALYLYTYICHNYRLDLLCIEWRPECNIYRGIAQKKEPRSHKGLGTAMVITLINM